MVTEGLVNTQYIIQMTHYRIVPLNLYNFINQCHPRNSIKKHHPHKSFGDRWKQQHFELPGGSMVGQSRGQGPVKWLRTELWPTARCSTALQRGFVWCQVRVDNLASSALCLCNACFWSFPLNSIMYPLPIYFILKSANMDFCHLYLKNRDWYEVWRNHSRRKIVKELPGIHLLSFRSLG